MIMKKKYVNPETDLVNVKLLYSFLEDGGMGTGTKNKGGGPDAKEQQLNFEDEETLPIDKNIWEEENEE